LGRTPDTIVAHRPLKDGVIADYRMTEAMLRYFINKALGGARLFRPEVMVAVPGGINSTERRAVVDATIRAGARAAYIIKEPIVAAIGADILAMRHKDEEALFAAAARVAQLSPVPIVNCGTSGIHHPTQALAEFYVAHDVFGDLNNLKVAVIGGIDNSRAINSFLYLLTEWIGITLYVVTSDGRNIKGGLHLYLEDYKDRIKVIETSDLDEVLPLVDIVYQSRIQWNHALDPETARKEVPPHVLNRRNVGRMQKHAVIFHPWPRNKELSREVDFLPQQRYIEVMRKAPFVRMALFANILGI